MNKPAIKTHPKDPRVAIVTCLADFKVAAQNPAIQAIIVQRAPDSIAAFKDAIASPQKTFSAPGLPYEGQIKFTAQRLIGHAEKPLHVSQNIGGTNPNQEKIVKAEILLMAQYFAAACPEEDMILEVRKGSPDTSAHPHPHPTMTDAWNCELGTAWPAAKNTPHDRKQYTNAAKPSDLFYMKPGFWHAGPTPQEDKSDGRILITCLPESAYNNE